MAKPIIDSACEGAKILWQQTDSGEGQESALMIEFFTETIYITQKGQRVTLNYDSVDNLCKLLKAHKK